MNFEKIVAILQVLMALGMIRFWYTWFRTEHNEPWLPKGYEEHEQVFVYPDMVLSFLMFVSAYLLWTGHPAGTKTTLIAGGMMLFLTVIDLAYFIRHDFFNKNKNGVYHFWGLIFPMIVMSFVMTIPFLIE